MRETRRELRRLTAAHALAVAALIVLAFGRAGWCLREHGRPVDVPAGGTITARSEDWPKIYAESMRFRCERCRMTEPHLHVSNDAVMSVAGAVR